MKIDLSILKGLDFDGCRIVLENNGYVSNDTGYSLYDNAPYDYSEDVYFKLYISDILIDLICLSNFYRNEKAMYDDFSNDTLVKFEISRLGPSCTGNCFLN